LRTMIPTERDSSTLGRFSVLICATSVRKIPEDKQARQGFYESEG
jgi:hypothetical protein